MDSTTWLSMEESAAKARSEAFEYYANKEVPLKPHIWVSDRTPVSHIIHLQEVYPQSDAVAVTDDVDIVPSSDESRIPIEDRRSNAELVLSRIVLLSSLFYTRDTARYKLMYPSKMQRQSLLAVSGGAPRNEPMTILYRERTPGILFL